MHFRGHHRAEENFFTNLGDRETRADDVDFRGKVGWGVGCLATIGYERINLGATSVMNNNIKAGRSKIMGHGQAHSSESNESYAHRAYPKYEIRECKLATWRSQLLRAGTGHVCALAWQGRALFSWRVADKSPDVEI